MLATSTYLEQASISTDSNRASKGMGLGGKALKQTQGGAACIKLSHNGMSSSQLVTNKCNIGGAF